MQSNTQAHANACKVKSSRIHGIDRLCKVQSPTCKVAKLQSCKDGKCKVQSATCKVQSANTESAKFKMQSAKCNVCGAHTTHGGFTRSCFGPRDAVAGPLPKPLDATRINKRNQPKCKVQRQLRWNNRARSSQSAGFYRRAGMLRAAFAVLRR